MRALNGRRGVAAMAEAVRSWNTAAVCGVMLPCRAVDHSLVQGDQPQRVIVGRPAAADGVVTVSGAGLRIPRHRRHGAVVPRDVALTITAEGMIAVPRHGDARLGGENNESFSSPTTYDRLLRIEVNRANFRHLIFS